MAKIFRRILGRSDFLVCMSKVSGSEIATHPISNCTLCCICLQGIKLSPFPPPSPWEGPSLTDMEWPELQRGRSSGKCRFLLQFSGPLWRSSDDNIWTTGQPSMTSVLIRWYLWQPPTFWRPFLHWIVPHSVNPILAELPLSPPGPRLHLPTPLLLGTRYLFRFFKLDVLWRRIWNRVTRGKAGHRASSFPHRL